MIDTLEIYTQGKLVFILTSDKIIVRTSLGQQFYLSPRKHYFNRRLKLIRVMVSLGEIRDLNELSEWCDRGVEWLPTDQKIVLDYARAGMV